jgi:hypothetical protein
LLLVLFDLLVGMAESAVTAELAAPPEPQAAPEALVAPAAPEGRRLLFR